MLQRSSKETFPTADDDANWEELVKLLLPVTRLTRL